MNEDLRQLRQKIDSDDSFMAAGHQIIKIRKRVRYIPEWASDNSLTRKLLSQVFPTWRTNSTQHKRAARWARVIHLYHRAGLPHGQVAKEMRMNYNTLRMLLRSIKRAANGFQAHDKKPRGVRPRGRPKK
jgi:hypothetical protein